MFCIAWFFSDVIRVLTYPNYVMRFHLGEGLAKVTPYEIWYTEQSVSLVLRLPGRW